MRQHSNSCSVGERVQHLLRALCDSRATETITQEYWKLTLEMAISFCQETAHRRAWSTSQCHCYR